MNIPLPHRLHTAAWAAEWPMGADLGKGEALSQDAIPPALAWAWSNARAVLDALSGQGDPVPLDRAHRFLDELDAWSARQHAFLTWPPTALGFARALEHSARHHDPALVAVLAAYPEFCAAMLADARRVDPSLPAFATLLPVPSVPVRSSPRPNRDAPPTAAAPSVPAPEPADAPGFLKKWARELETISEPALARQYIDQQIKQQAPEGPSVWSWFDRVLLPGLLALPEADLERVVDAWPHHNRFTPPDPVAWVDQPRLWRTLRDAPAPNRALLMEHGLASMLNLDEVGAHTRLLMLTKMLPFTAKSPTNFKQRLVWWQSMGGHLDAQLDAPLAPEGGEGAADIFSARGWIEAQQNEDWETVMTALQSAPSETRFQRRSPRR